MIGNSNESSIAGVILAAGRSERLGEPKQLLQWHGEPFVVHIARNAIDARLTPLIVVTGANHQQVEDVMRELPVRIVYNPRWSEGLSTSMKAGLGELSEGCRAVMFLLGDQPQIPSDLIHKLIERFTRHHAAITAPKVGGRRGNPVLFSQEVFPALKGVTGDKGGRGIFDQFEVDWLPWADERILLDVDDTEDLTKLRQAYDIKN